MEKKETMDTYNLNLANKIDPEDIYKYNDINYNNNLNSVEIPFYWVMDVDGRKRKKKYSKKHEKEKNHHSHIRKSRKVTYEKSHHTPQLESSKNIDHEFDLKKNKNSDINTKLLKNQHRNEELVKHVKHKLVEKMVINKDDKTINKSTGESITLNDSCSSNKHKYNIVDKSQNNFKKKYQEYSSSSKITNKKLSNKLKEAQSNQSDKFSNGLNNHKQKKTPNEKLKIEPNSKSEELDEDLDDIKYNVTQKTSGHVRKKIGNKLKKAPNFKLDNYRSNFNNKHKKQKPSNNVGKSSSNKLKEESSGGESDDESNDLIADEHSDEFDIYTNNLKNKNQNQKSNSKVSNKMKEESSDESDEELNDSIENENTDETNRHDNNLKNNHKKQKLNNKVDTSSNNKYNNNLYESQSKKSRKKFETKKEKKGKKFKDSLNNKSDENTRDAINEESTDEAITIKYDNFLSRQVKQKPNTKIKKRDNELKQYLRKKTSKDFRNNKSDEMIKITQHNYYSNQHLKRKNELPDELKKDSTEKRSKPLSKLISKNERKSKK
ncbi:putative uncharacterized protein DDB_G0282133 isoform X2 [Melanaphis sacchari]|nr:putative uncharacterized protein DDB_G0282133 isoform X2 [Melanaphis sacchari]